MIRYKSKRLVSGLSDRLDIGQAVEVISLATCLVAVTFDQKRQAAGMRDPRTRDRNESTYREREGTTPMTTTYIIHPEDRSKRKNPPTSLARKWK